MNHQHKFLKYTTKNKILSSKIDKLENESWVQSGGEIPLHKYLKNIGLFEPESEIDDFLNPIFGYLWIKTNAIQNYWVFDGFRSGLHKFIKSMFYCIPETNSVRPAQKIYGTIRPYDIGRYLAWKFNCFLNHARRAEIESEFKSAKNYDSALGNILNISRHFKESKDEATFNTIVEKHRDILSSAINEIIDSLKLDLKKETIEEKLIPPLTEYKTIIADRKKLLETELKKFCKEDRPAFGFDLPDSSKVNEIIDLIDKSFVYNDMDYYHVLLAVLISVATNKEGIKQYYEGINSIGIGAPIIIPDDFVTDFFTKDEISVELIKEDEQLDDYYRICVLLTNPKNITLQDHGRSTLYNQCKPPYPHVSATDCGETSLRNFIKIITYDDTTETYNIEILDKLGAIEEIKEFFRIFNDDAKQNDDKTKVEIFGGNYNVKDAWFKITSGLDGVKYNSGCAGEDNIAEINSGLNVDESGSNMLQVITQLFKNVVTWESFNEIIGARVIARLDEDGHGTVQVLVDYLWEFYDRHYLMDSDNIRYVLSTKIFKPKRQFYIDALSYKPISVEHPHKKDYFYFRMLTKVLMINMLNKNEEIENLDYEALLLYDKFTERDKYGIFIKMHKINNLTKIKDIQFISGKKTLENIKSVPNLIISANNINSLEFMHSLESITFTNMFNQELGTSLNQLKNLKSLTFGHWFNQELGTSLDELQNLESLIFGFTFNRKLYGSLNKLKNLKSLTFGYSFNQKLGASLDELKNLESLTLGRFCVVDLDVLLPNLPKLKKLEYQNTVRFF